LSFSATIPLHAVFLRQPGHSARPNTMIIPILVIAALALLVATDTDH
jgi:hypothetical protein